MRESGFSASRSDRFCFRLLIAGLFRQIQPYNIMQTKIYNRFAVLCFTLNGPAA